MWTHEKPKTEGWYWYRDAVQTKPSLNWVNAYSPVMDGSRWLMKPICATCTHASWNTDKAGQLHKSGDGMCKAPLPAIPELPKAYYWIRPPVPGAGIADGMINRKAIRFAECDFFHDVTWGTGENQ